MAAGHLITVIDDDESVRRSLPNLLRQFGFATHDLPQYMPGRNAPLSLGGVRCSRDTRKLDSGLV